MPRVSRRRLGQLERQLSVKQPPIGRLFVLIPELWLQEDQDAFLTPERGEPLAELVERRTGVRPIWDSHHIWAIIHHLPEEARTWDEVTKAAFLAAHETRPRRPNHWAWREGADGDRRGGA